MLVVSEIYKSYRKKHVLAGASFQAEAGTCVGIVGGNGSGKTTLLSILAGTLKTDGGSILYEGVNVTGNRKFCSSHIAYVPQENPLMEELTVKDNLRLWYRGFKILRTNAGEEPYVMLGLGDLLHMPVGKLSGGMKKRLSIACALSNHAPILILDEPGAALDLACKAAIREYLKQYCQQGGMVILTSHEREELSLCNVMYALKRGRLEQIDVGLSTEKIIACWM